MALYNKGMLSQICSEFGDCEKTPGGMSGGISVCVSELCVSRLCKQFVIFNTFMFLMKRRSDAVSLSSTLSQERLACIAFISAL